MTASLDDWNVDPNETYFVWIGQNAGAGRVELYPTLADVQAKTNRIAYGDFVYGTEQSVVMENDTTEPTIERYNTYISYHVKVTLLGGDTVKIFAKKPNTDLPDIVDSLLVEEATVIARGTKEINDHTNVRIEWTLLLGSHMPELDVDDIVRFTESQRGLDKNVCVTEIMTQGYVTEGEAAVVETLRAEEFKAMKR